MKCEVGAVAIFYTRISFSCLPGPSCQNENREFRVVLLCLQKCIYYFCGSLAQSRQIRPGHCAEQLAGIEQQEHREPDLTGGGALAPE